MTSQNERIPPLPPKLKEMLVDYPEILQHLQEALIEVAQETSPTPPFERALWVLEGIMGDHMMKAAAELRGAEACGDQAEIETAMVKDRLMSRARSRNIGLADLHELADFFDDGKGGWQ